MRVGESLEGAWQTFKQHTGALVGATFALILTQGVVQAILARALHFPMSFLLNLLVSGLVMGGLMNVARIAARGQEPTVSDAFAPFASRQGDYLIVGLAAGSGSILCGLGVLVTGYLFLFAPLLVVDGKDFRVALRESKDLAIAHLGDLLGLFIILIGLNVLGVLTFVGWLAALPITSLMVVHAYEQVRTRSLPSGDFAAPAR
jgi:hypothetical protein